MKIKLNIVLQKYLTVGNKDYFILPMSVNPCFAYGLETPLGRTEKPSTYANHGFDET